MADSVDQILTRLAPGRFDATRAANFALVREQVCEQSFTRTLTIERADVPTGDGQDSRTVELAFASDTPVEHWFGMLELSMKPGAMRDARLKTGAPLCTDHTMIIDRMVGVVESFAIKNGKARAVTRFADTPRPDEVYRMVKDGIIQNVSVGFTVHNLELLNEKEVRKGAIPMYRSDDWEPYEISLVCAPADIGAGVGRSFNPSPNSEPETRAIPNTTENTMTPEEIAAAAAAEAQRTAAPAVEKRSATQIAIDGLRGWKETFPKDEPVIEAYIRENLAGGVFSGTEAGLLARINASQPPSVRVPPPPVEDVARQQGGVQLARTVSRVNLKAFKGEGAHERAYRSGMHLAAVLNRDETAVQFCRDNGISLKRTQTGTDNTKGGFTVLPEFEQTIFELLLQYGVARRVCDVRPMTSDTKIVTRRTGGLTAYPVGAGQRGTYSTITDDQFELVARKWMVLSKEEVELGEDAFISWADRVANEAGQAFAFSEDDCLFNGDGTSTYHGIVGLTQKILGLSATRSYIAGAVVASGNAWSEIVIGDLLALVGKLPSFARNSGNVRWYCTSEFWATVLQRLALAGGGVTHAEFEGQLKESFLGKPVEIVEAMQHTEANDTIPLLYGNVYQASTFGDRRGITVKRTDSNDVDFESDLEATKFTERFDINVHDIGNYSATAGLRKAGPVVALLTAAS